MNNKAIKIWGREFHLNLIYKTYSGEGPLSCQVAAVDEFKPSVIDEVKGEVEKYIIKYNLKEIGRESIDNIFKYVMPKAIYVPQVPEHKIIALMCYCKLDMEHGLAIVFEDNKLMNIGEEDIVL